MYYFFLYFSHLPSIIYYFNLQLITFAAANTYYYNNIVYIDTAQHYHTLFINE